MHHLRLSDVVAWVLLGILLAMIATARREG